jgi:hypothetical protein
MAELARFEPLGSIVPAAFFRLQQIARAWKSALRMTEFAARRI